MKVKKYHVVRFDNRLIYQGSYYLPARAFKMLAYIIAQYVDPQTKQLPSELNIPVREIELALKSDPRRRWNKFSEEVDGLCKELTSNPIRFREEVEVKGIKMKGYINWCSSAMTYRNEQGRVYVRLGFDTLIAQFLLDLDEYVRLYSTEIHRLQGSHSIRLFQIFKGIRDRRRKHERLTMDWEGRRYHRVSRQEYEVNELKFLLGIEEHYKLFKHFNRQVIKRSIAEINLQTSVRILRVEQIRRGRSVVALNFYFADQDPSVPLGLPVVSRDKLHLERKRVPSPKELSKLTYAQEAAYLIFTEFGVYPGIAFYQFLPSINGSEVKGFEDHFAKLALQHFEQWATYRKSKKDLAAVFVSWWLKLKVFEPSSDVWTKIIEQLIKLKKEMQATGGTAYDNRMQAKTMTAAGFREWYKSR